LAKLTPWVFRLPLTLGAWSDAASGQQQTTRRQTIDVILQTRDHKSGDGRDRGARPAENGCFLT